MSQTEVCLTIKIRRITIGQLQNTGRPWTEGSDQASVDTLCQFFSVLMLLASESHLKRLQMLYDINFHKRVLQ